MAVPRRRIRIAELLQDVPPTEVKALACRAALRRLVVEFDFFDRTFPETQTSTLVIMMVGRQAVALTLNAKFPDGYIEGRTADPFLSLTLDEFKEAKAPREQAIFSAYFINAVFGAMEGNRDLDDSKLIADCLPRSEKVDGWNFDTALHEVERDVADVRVASTPFSVFTKPLFRETVRPEFRALVSNMTDPRVDFFRRWFERVEIGQPLEWELQRRVALIPEQIWQAGADAIADAISSIERAFRTEVGPRPVLTDTGLVDVSEDQAIDEEPLAFACGQVDVALMAALASDAGNGLTETSVETVLIKSALDKHGSQPSVVATSFWNACMSLDRQIGDVYPETTALIALKNTLYVSVEELCAQNDVIRDRIGKLAALETRRYPTEDEREDIKSVPGAVQDVTTPRAQAELQEIVDIVIATEKPPRVWRARLVNWVTVLGQIIDKGQKNQKRVDWLIKLGGRIAKWFDELE